MTGYFMIVFVPCGPLEAWFMEVGQDLYRPQF